MKKSLGLARAVFICLSVLIMGTYASLDISNFTYVHIIMGGLMGALIGAVVIGIDISIRKLHLKTFNTLIFGLLIGYALAQGLYFIFDRVIHFASPHYTLMNYPVFGLSLLIASIYLGVAMTFRYSDEINISIPFFHGKAPDIEKPKYFLLTMSALLDARIVDLANSGLLDDRLVLPKFIIEDLYTHSDAPEESLRLKARRGLDNIKKLEAIPDLHLIHDIHVFPDAKQSSIKIDKLATQLEAYILTSESHLLHEHPDEKVRIINIQTLAHALKPLMEAGEALDIKVQRYGKEARQGVGYLEDGTMVVINGGGDYIGQTIHVNVLSVKHTSSGRIIFCNADEPEMSENTYPAFREHQSEKEEESGQYASF